MTQKEMYIWKFIHQTNEKFKKEQTEDMDIEDLNKILDNLNKITSFENLISFIHNNENIVEKLEYDLYNKDIQSIVNYARRSIFYMIYPKKLNSYDLETLYNIRDKLKNIKHPREENSTSDTEDEDAFLRILFGDETFSKLGKDHWVDVEITLWLYFRT